VIAAKPACRGELAPRRYPLACQGRIRSARIACSADCSPSAIWPVLGSEEIRFALDAGGNVLIPFVWDGIREQLDGEPAARLVSAEFSLSIAFPGPTFLASFAPDGRVIAPAFEPQVANTEY
jgi:hypothetical protein